MRSILEHDQPTEETVRAASHTLDLAEALRVVSVNSSYNASRALSKWLKRGVRLTADGFLAVPFAEVVEATGTDDEPVAALHMALTGDIQGDMLLMFPEAVALELVDIPMSNPAGTTKRLGEFEQSCLQETGNNVGTSFTNSLATWLRLQVVPACPTFVYDMAAAIIQPILAGHAQVADEALVAKTDFELDGRQLDWTFLLLPSVESLALMREHCATDKIRRNALHTIAVNGAFNASRAMSKWLRRGVRLSTEGFVSVPLSEVCDEAHSDETVVGVHLTLGDQMRGHTLLVMPMPTAYKLVDIVTNAKPGTTRQMDEMAVSCLQETGNILSSSFMNSLSKWLDITAEPSAPQVKIDMLEAIFGAVIVEQAKVGDDAFLAKSVFSVDGQWLEWDFYFLPSPSSLRLIEASCDD